MNTYVKVTPYHMRIHAYIFENVDTYTRTNKNSYIHTSTHSS